MRSIIKSKIGLLAAFVGLIGGSIWIYQSGLEPEPIIIFFLSVLEIIGFFIIGDSSVETIPQNSNTNTNIMTVNINGEKLGTKTENDERKKAQTRILFIDDNHTDFRMVSILKKSGWINTKSVKDIKDLDDPKVQEAHIIFVDINGVGIHMFQDQGLGLAAALKKKYNSKKIVIYSAENTGDRFHKALREVDSCLPKDAEPYQFIHLIEGFNI